MSVLWSFNKVNKWIHLLRAVVVVVVVVVVIGPLAKVSLRYV